MLTVILAVIAVETIGLLFTTFARGGTWTAVAIVWLMIMIAAVGMAVFLVATGKRERAGIERFVFTPSGVARLPMKPPADGTLLDTQFTPWVGQVRMDVKRISPFWRRIRVTGESGGSLVTLFVAGVRCTDADAERVGDLIRQCMAGKVITPPTRDVSAHPPTTPAA
ncbi:MAG: hypothetical protein ACREJO_11060 [Phycisphaerales bacterium]